MVTDNIDAIALVGHVVSEISSIRCEQLRPSLKQEFQTISSNSVSSLSKLLFGDDLAKQIRDAKRRAASAKQSAPIKNMTAPETVGATTLIKVVDMTKAVFFGERIPLNWAEKTVHRSEQ